METLSIHGRTIFNIRDVLTGARVPCRLSKDQLEEAQAAVGRRAAVSGRVRYSPTGKPQTINVEQIRHLREQKDLPQFKDLAGINLTDGADPVEYIQRFRDAEWSRGAELEPT